jgi:hypothetical protein
LLIELNVLSLAKRLRLQLLVDSVGDAFQWGGFPMKIHLRIEGIADLYKLFSKKKDVYVDFPGGTLRDFTNALIRNYGPAVKKAILDQAGEIDMGFRVVVNQSAYLSYGERMDVLLHDGDTLHLMTVG